MSVYRIDYRPTAKQAAFHQSAADEVLYGGAAGGGKSKALVMDAFVRCIETAGYQAYLFRRTYPELEDTLIAEALRSIPKALFQYNASKHDLRFVNGSVMRFRHCQSEKDVWLYQGAEMHGLYIDELTHFSKSMYDYFKTRLRVPARFGRFQPVTRCASNPGGIGHSWVKTHFVDAGPPLIPHKRRIASATLGKTQTRTVQYIPSLATENPHISLDYVFELEQKPAALRKALLLGDWNAFEGQVFAEFVDDPAHYHDQLHTHVIEPFAIPTHWKRYRSFDFGYSHPFSVGWWAMSPDGTAYRYREWYGCTSEPNVGLKLSPREIARGIAEREADERREGLRILGVADPAIWDVSTGISIENQMSAEGVYFEKADNSRLPGKMQMHYRLGFDSDGRPGLYIFRTCREWLRTVPTLPYSATKAEDVDTDAEDHAYDETRYFCMAWPTGPRAHAPEAKPLLDPLNQKKRR